MTVGYLLIPTYSVLIPLYMVFRSVSYKFQYFFIIFIRLRSREVIFREYTEFLNDNRSTRLDH